MSDWVQTQPVSAIIAATFTGVASIVAAVLYGVSRLQRAHASHFDIWLYRHESAERKQFRTIKRLAVAVRKDQKATSESFDRLAGAVATILQQYPREQQYHMRSHVLHDPETGEPIYRIPPDEMYPEALMTAAQLADQRDWGHGPLGLAELHAKGIRGEGVIVAVCDTGIDTTHPDLAGRVIASMDFTRSSSGAADRQGHGSHCAGIVGASEDGNGIIGASPRAKIINAKVLGDNGSGGSTGIASGIRWAADQGADIISLSLGAPSLDNAIASAITYAGEKGCWVVAAAGNEGPREGTVGYPGGLPNVVCVAAIDQGLRVASFSSRGAAVDIAAPGVQITSLAPGGRYAVMSGTSMATPYVAGCLALVRAELKKNKLPVPKLAEILAELKATAKDLDSPGNDTRTGAGLLQPAKLIEKLIGTKPVDPVDPPADNTIVVEMAAPAELKSRGVQAIRFVISPAKANDDGDFVGDLPIGGPSQEWLGIAIKVLKVVLPYLREWAKKTNTPIDDMMIDILDQITKQSQSVKGNYFDAKESPTWWPIAVQVLRMLTPLLKDLASKTRTPFDDMMIRLIERLITRTNDTSTAEQRQSKARKFAESAGLVDRCFLESK